ncbi:hypothetical protein N7495_001763 [Penicillium taxi]|uniref:uncharacterized protein n=1 Tax=Penicillium taxi TaxID=168475 RepID=UPI00254556F9|nr:uncharacterized protein N7495_001763 [Penicillium taxi]KAJ5909081.1 hypothetical protein N7495_001763 [Penicillium taxi]
MLDMTELRSRYETVRVTEDSKDKIIEACLELLSCVQSLEGDLHREKNEYQDQKVLVENYREKAKGFEEEAKNSRVELEEKSRKEAKLKFASVLVDGDHMNVSAMFPHNIFTQTKSLQFRDKFVQMGQKGGRQAARALIEAVQDHVQEVVSDASPNICYKIRVYANMAGLANTYCNASVVSSQGIVRSFIQGFNMEDALCDFVDAGSGKECSDVKIGALLERDCLDIHCQRIIFCGSADNGYARILGPHRKSNRISLVEGPPFADELKDLASVFATASFPEVFRSEKLPRRVSFGGITATKIPTPPQTPAPNYADIAKNTPSMSNDSSLTTNSPTKALPTGGVKLSVCKNANGERVDSPLQFSTKGKIDVLKQHKFCNQFHILGSCSWGEKSCIFKHEPGLVEKECNDVSCINGHRCPHGNCGRDCKFPHNVDTRIVTRI